MSSVTVTSLSYPTPLSSPALSLSLSQSIHTPPPSFLPYHPHLQPPFIWCMPNWHCHGNQWSAECQFVYVNRGNWKIREGRVYKCVSSEWLCVQSETRVKEVNILTLTLPAPPSFGRHHLHSELCPLTEKAWRMREGEKERETEL